MFFLLLKACSITIIIVVVVTVIKCNTLQQMYGQFNTI